MNAHFGGRQGKDEPPAAGIHGGKAENVAKEGSIAFRILAIEEEVRQPTPGLIKRLALETRRSINERAEALRDWTRYLQHAADAGEVDAQHMLAVCKPGGMVATVMPHGVLFRGGVEKEIRKKFRRAGLHNTHTTTVSAHDIL